MSGLHPCSEGEESPLHTTDDLARIGVETVRSAKKNLKRNVHGITIE